MTTPAMTGRRHRPGGRAGTALATRLATPLATLQAVLLAVLLTATLLAAPGRTSTRGPTGCEPLSPAQLVAQLVGAPLRHPNPSPEARTLAADHAGTIVLLGGAISSGEQVDGLIDALDDAAPAGLPPLVAVDEEGGRVARFGQAGVTTHLPSARDIADTTTPDQVRALGADLGSQLAALGVDWDLAPVLDLTAAPADTVIGDRSYGTDPDTVGAYASAFAEGLRQAGILTAGKHFPDHGLTTVDTHQAAVTVQVDPATLATTHLQPYRIARPHLDAIMLSHLRVPALDPAWPVSLSPAAITFLRQQLDFDGVVVTDDLSMQAVADVADEPTAAVQAIAAGADLVLAGSLQTGPGVHTALLAAVEDGRISLERVRRAARRVLALKGVADATASCLLGLPPIEQARGILDGAGRQFLVEGGSRRGVPDLQTAEAHHLDPVRYSDDEIASLPQGPPLASVRRYQPATVASPGADPLDVAVQRAVDERGPMAAHRVVVVNEAVSWTHPLAARLAGTDPVLPDVGTGAQRRQAVDQVAAPDAEVVVVGSDTLGVGQVAVAGNDPVAEALAVDAATTQPAGLVVAAPGSEGLSTLLPLLAAGEVGLLYTPATSLDPRVADAVEAHRRGDTGIAVVAVGVAPEVATALGAEVLSASHAALAGWVRAALGTPGALMVHDGPGHLLAALPLAARARAIAVPGPAPTAALADTVADWWLSAASPRPAYLAGVTAEPWLDLGLPSHYRRPPP